MKTERLLNINYISRQVDIDYGRIKRMNLSKGEVEKIKELITTESKKYCQALDLMAK